MGRNICFTSPAQWWSRHLWTHGARMFLETIVETRGEAALEQFKAEALTQMEAMRQPEGYPERFFAHFTVTTQTIVGQVTRERISLGRKCCYITGVKIRGEVQLHRAGGTRTHKVSGPST